MMAYQLAFVKLLRSCLALNFLENLAEAVIKIMDFTCPDLRYLVKQRQKPKPLVVLLVMRLLVTHSGLSALRSMQIG